MGGDCPACARTGSTPRSVRMDLVLIVSLSSLDIVRSYLFISESIAKRLLF
jgi:hypothetical protein